MNFLKKTEIFSHFSRSNIKFKDRQNASELLCYLLKNKFNKILSNKAVLILGIPRGGIVLGDIIASKFGHHFNIIIPRRIVAPHNRELSIGGIMKDSTLYLNSLLIKNLGITSEYLNLVKKEQLLEIKKREMLLGHQIEGERIKEKNIILVDDGIATGATMIVASRWIRKYEPNKLVILTPICPKPVLELLKKEADYVESILTPSLKHFSTVEMFYQRFEELDFDILNNIFKKYKNSTDK